MIQRSSISTLDTEISKECNGCKSLEMDSNQTAGRQKELLLDPVVQKHNELRSRRNANEEEIITVDDVF